MMYSSQLLLLSFLLTLDLIACSCAHHGTRTWRVASLWEWALEAETWSPTCHASSTAFHTHWGTHQACALMGVHLSVSWGRCQGIRQHQIHFSVLQHLSKYIGHVLFRYVASDEFHTTDRIHFVYVYWYQCWFIRIWIFLFLYTLFGYNSLNYILFQ